MKHAGGRPRVEFDREGAVAAYEALTPWEIKAMMREANARFVAALREARA